MARKFQATDKIKLAVVVGGHPFDVPGFRDLFGRMPEVDCYIQDVDNWACSVSSGQWDQYDAFLFYTMVNWGVNSIRPDMDKPINEALARLGESKQGILVLHHALLNWMNDPIWAAICNVQDRKLGAFVGQTLHCEIGPTPHPITRGLTAWDMVDESYTMATPPAPSVPLITTQHPKSMSVLAWAHTYKNARVVGCELGHDNEAYTNPGFETLLLRAIKWLAWKI